VSHELCSNYLFSPSPDFNSKEKLFSQRVVAQWNSLLQNIVEKPLELLFRKLPTPTCGLQPHFFTALSVLWLLLKSGTFVINYRTLNKIHSGTCILQQKQLWLELHFDITLNKPDFNTWQCRCMVYRSSMSTTNISSTIYPHSTQ